MNKSHNIPLNKIGRGGVQFKTLKGDQKMYEIQSAKFARRVALFA